MYNGGLKGEGSLSAEAIGTLNLTLEVRCSPDEYIHSLNIFGENIHVRTMCQTLC